LADQAAILVNIGLEHFPVDTSLLDLSTKIGLTMGESPNAIQTGYLSVLLEPENNDLKKHLACILEQSGDWTTAFDERKQIIAQSSAPATDDLLHLANCSIKINKPQIANSICKGILANDPENTEANLYLGEALINQNDFDEGIVYLKQACLISPENFATWLKLAQAFQTFHKDDIALETLKEAVNVIPDSAEIRQALSILLLQHGTLSEALPHLKAAYDLNPLMLQTVLLLGQTLTKLGHVEEANKILEDSRVSYPNNKELALLHGQILVQLGRHTEAWPLLQTGLEIASDNIDALIAYGKSVLSLSKNEPEISEASGENPIPLPDINKAILALNTAVNINPTNIEARLILNELLFAHQEFQKALDGFMQISKLGESKNSEWNWQILLGEGKSALKLGLVDRALISLREAAAVKPDHIQIQQQLADAYFQADLRSEANELAQTVLYLAPQDLGVLIWYSSIKARLGQYPSAVASLEKAIQLSPDRLDLLVRLAENEHRSGHDELVQKALEQVLANPLANTEILRQSANLYTDIGDLPSAIAYLEKARDLTTSPSVDLLCELVRAYEANQNILAALSTINYLLDGNANDLPLLEMKMRLLIKANQLDEALECAKNALT
jgi:tetratricopeptide (TPR) repeat protein